MSDVAVASDPLLELPGVAFAVAVTIGGSLVVAFNSATPQSPSPPTATVSMVLLRETIASPNTIIDLYTRDV